MLHATVYMRPPEGLKCPEGKVLLVKKSLYGLKQSGREWYIVASRGLESLGFSSCFSEPCLFVTPDRGLIVGLYVDDMLIIGADPKRVQDLVERIAALWEVRDLGDAGAILNIRITRDREKKTLSINQGLYIDKLIERFRLGDAKPMSLPASDRNALIRGHSGEP
jgi:hypothetical protein